MSSRPSRWAGGRCSSWMGASAGGRGGSRRPGPPRPRGGRPGRVGLHRLPGIIDPHQHLLGGSGEKGFHTQTPQIFLSELITAGVTTVVGCLGVDTTMKTLAGLIARVKGLRHEGLDVWMWTGRYNVPPTTITDSVRDDIMFLAEVIGCGEVAISDERATDTRGPGPPGAWPARGRAGAGSRVAGAPPRHRGWPLPHERRADYGDGGISGGERPGGGARGQEALAMHD